MSKLYKYGILLLVVALILPWAVSCKKTEEQPQTVYYTVSFDSNGGSPVENMRVEANGHAVAPPDPTRENYIFNGWTYGNETWIFDWNVVKGDMTLKASWKSADTIFRYEPLGDDEHARVTGVYDLYPTLHFPTTINGFVVSSIGEGAFSMLSSEDVERIILPETITTVEDGAFEGCSGIEFQVEGVLSHVGEAAFSECDGLRAVALGEGMDRIAVSAFAKSGLSRILIPNGVQVIEENAFDGCASLKTIVLPESLLDSEIAVEDSAFRECEALLTVFFYGDAEKHDALKDKITTGNSCLKSATFCYYAEVKPTGTGNYWYMHNGEPRVW